MQYNIEKFMEFMHLIEKLKCNTRHSWTSSGRQESVAEHTFRMAFMAMMLKETFNNLDINKVIELCLIHDIGEAVTGDIPSFLKKNSDEKHEEECVEKIFNSIQSPVNMRLKALYSEWIMQETPESKLAKALDKLDVVIEHNEADLDTWIDFEHYLNQVYGKKECSAFEWTADLRELATQDTRKKLVEAGIDPDAAMEKYNSDKL